MSKTMENFNILTSLLERKKKPANISLKIWDRQQSGNQLSWGLFSDTCHSSQNLYCRDLPTGNSGPFSPRSIAFSDDGMQLAACFYNCVVFWNIDAVLDGKTTPVPKRMQSQHEFRVDCLVFSPDNQRIISSSSGSQSSVIIHDIST